MTAGTVRHRVTDLDTEDAPLVSVVMATYNRSNVLGLAIQSVIAQSLTNWELLVIGDACTDDSAETVAGFGDSRIRWTNLPVNVGDQSGPNNEGVRQARGQYVAYLNHDDIWFPDHLETAVSAIRAIDADLVFTLGASLSQSGRMSVTGIAPSGRYTLLSFVPASTWVMRRGLADEVGPWLSPHASREVPSQHWLALAHAAGRKLHQVPALTTVLIASTAFDQAYRTRRSVEHVNVLARMRDVHGYRAELLTRLVLDQGEVEWPRSLVANARVSLKHLLHRGSARVGIHPHATAAALRLQGRGAWLNRVYLRRGIDRT